METTEAKIVNRNSPISMRPLLLALALSTMTVAVATSRVAAQDIEILSIADEIKSKNDCSDQSNQECKSLFENTCSWVGNSSIVIRDGLMQSIPGDRIGQRIVGELVEIAEGSGGYVDLPLAESFISPMESYFLQGQYDAEFSNFNNQSGLTLGLMAGMAMNGKAQSSEVDEALRKINDQRDQALRQKWYNTCIQTAYLW